MDDWVNSLEIDKQILPVLASKFKPQNSIAKRVVIKRLENRKACRNRKGRYRGRPHKRDISKHVWPNRSEIYFERI
jgi:hypothetical protein